jgi:REP element-mobilizing transposase RayT
MRVEYPGAIYHVMDRGDRREDIFVNDVDRQDLIRTLAEACEKTGWQVHAYCLMRNHFHLVLETANANLVEGMRWFLSAYTIRLNHRQKLFGHVFSGRYKALIVHIAHGNEQDIELLLGGADRGGQGKGEERGSDNPFHSVGVGCRHRSANPKPGTDPGTMICLVKSPRPVDCRTLTFA